MFSLSLRYFQTFSWVNIWKFQDLTISRVYSPSPEAIGLSAGQRIRSPFKTHAFITEFRSSPLGSYPESIEFGSRPISLRPILTLHQSACTCLERPLTVKRADSNNVHSDQVITTSVYATFHQYRQINGPIYREVSKLKIQGPSLARAPSKALGENFAKFAIVRHFNHNPLRSMPFNQLIKTLLLFLDFCNVSDMSTFFQIRELL
jgi:hypothetical protein